MAGSRIFCQFSVLKNAFTSGNIGNRSQRIVSPLGTNLYTTNAAPSANNPDNEMQRKEKNMSKAMKAYLTRAKEYDEFINKERSEYEIGKRHLANMMGVEESSFTQPDINSAIEYLFPSGLYEKRARPSMLPPEEAFPPRKEAEFNELGRPHHSMFYTRKPNYYKALYDIVEELEKLKAYEDQMIKKKVLPDPNNAIDLGGTAWLNKKEFESRLLETLSDEMHEYLITTLDRVVEHPYSYTIKDFLLTFRKKTQSFTDTVYIPPLEYDSEGRPYIVVKGCMRKEARGEVTLRGNGSGKITINGCDISYFDTIQDREQVIFPLIFTNRTHDIDVEATVVNGGPTGQSGAIRWGIAWGLRSFVDIQTVEKMRVAGLLTRDWRTRERKKPGQEGARRKFTWKKR